MATGAYALYVQETGLGPSHHVRDATFFLNLKLTDTSTRAIYIRPDPYLRSDAVFGVKDSLIVELTIVDEELAKTYGVPEGTKLLVHDFVLVSEEATEKLRDINAIEAVQKLFPGRNVRLLDHLPVVDVD